MGYRCPRCGLTEVRRGSSSTAQAVGGLVGAMLAMAFGGLQCPKCGTIPKREFPPDTQSQILMGTLGLVGGAVVVLVVVLALLAWLNSSR